MRVSNILWLALLTGNLAFGLVRTLTVDETTMAEIHLAMGRSTVLHFTEKPSKVVAGNQNYFNIEFIGSDVTIQPLSQVSSNLFAYGEYHRYGFILKVSGGERYDDLVQIRWKTHSLVLPPVAKTLALPPPNNKVTPDRIASQTFAATVTKVFYNDATHLHVIELEIKDKTGIASKGVTVDISQNKKTLPITAIVFDKDYSDMLKARIFTQLTRKKPAVVQIGIGDRKTSITIQGSHL